MERSRPHPNTSKEQRMGYIAERQKEYDAMQFAGASDVYAAASSSSMLLAPHPARYLV